VVFEAGLGAARTAWGLVQPAVAQQTRTLAYDRAGLGRSTTPAPGPRTIQRMADDLEDLLDHDGHAPYVLTGHSLGGPVLRCLVARRPDLAAALVLVDPVAEDCDFYYGRLYAAAVRGMYHLAGVLCAGGLLARLYSGGEYRILPPDLAAQARRENLSRATMRTSAAEMAALAQGLAVLRAGDPPPPGIPVTVISGGRCGPMEKRIRPTVVESHRRYAAALPQGRHLVAERSGHLIQLDQPDIIVTELQTLITSLR
jgi:pimeloyl-ACP methyl ester carboxylesterase